MIIYLRFVLSGLKLYKIYYGFFKLITTVQFYLVLLKSKYLFGVFCSIVAVINNCATDQNNSKSRKTAIDFLKISWNLSYSQYFHYWHFSCLQCMVDSQKRKQKTSQISGHTAKFKDFHQHLKKSAVCQVNFQKKKSHNATKGCHSKFNCCIGAIWFYGIFCRTLYGDIVHFQKILGTISKASSEYYD